MQDAMGILAEKDAIGGGNTGEGQSDRSTAARQDTIHVRARRMYKWITYRILTILN